MPVAVTNLGSGVTSISAGEYHTCAVVSGAAKCWGGSTKGQLGTLDGLSVSVPNSVIGLDHDVQKIKCGYYYSCAVANGKVKCWGENSQYQLGDKTTTDRWQPVDVEF